MTDDKVRAEEFDFEGETIALTRFWHDQFCEPECDPTKLETERTGLFLRRAFAAGLAKGEAERAALVQSNSRLTGMYTNAFREREALRAALDGLLELVMNANEGAFKNGVTDSTGTVDEGDVRASERINAARTALALVRKGE